MHINSYLSFNGQCEAAFKFYEQCLGGKIDGMRTYAGTPAEELVPAEWRDKILHAGMTVGDGELTGADVPPGSYEEPRGFHVLLHMKDRAAGERIFNALSEKGKVEMPFQQTFWAAGFGMCVDQFGIPWMVNCELGG